MATIDAPMGHDRETLFAGRVWFATHRPSQNGSCYTMPKLAGTQLYLPDTVAKMVSVFGLRLLDGYNSAG